MTKERNIDERWLWRTHSVDRQEAYGVHLNGHKQSYHSKLVLHTRYRLQAIFKSTAPLKHTALCKLEYYYL